MNTFEGEERIQVRVQNTPRVLHIFGQMYKAGAESRTMDIYRSIDRTKIQFDFVVTKPGEHAYFEEIKLLGGRLFYIDPPKLKGVLSHAIQLYNVLKNRGPFLAVHAHTAFNEGIAVTVARIAGVRCRVAHSRSASDLDYGKFYKKLYRIVMQRLILINSTHLLACGVEAGRYLFGKRAVEQKKVIFLPNAIDISMYKKSIINRDKIRCEFGISDNCTVIGTLGNLREVKNHTFLLDIFKDFLLMNHNAYLMIVGEGPLMGCLLQKAKNLGIEGQVLLPGRRDDIPAVLQAFDIFVMPSLYEGAPGAAIEAQASGLPCILSDRITRDVDVGTGFVQYIPLESPVHLWAVSIKKVLEYDKPEIEVNQKLLYAKGYDVLSSVSRLMSVYGL